MDDRKMISFAVSNSDEMTWDNLAKVERALLKQFEELEARLEKRISGETEGDEKQE